MAAETNLKVVRSTYDRIRIRHKSAGETLTKQEFKDDGNPNVIFRRFLKTGVAPPRYTQLAYGDASQVSSLDDAVELANEARDAFESLPSAVRQLAGGDFQRFHGMLHDADQALAIQRAGLDLGIEDPERVGNTPPVTSPAPPAPPSPTDPPDGGPNPPSEG